LDEDVDVGADDVVVEVDVSNVDVDVKKLENFGLTGGGGTTFGVFAGAGAGTTFGVFAAGAGAGAGGTTLGVFAPGGLIVVDTVKNEVRVSVPVNETNVSVSSVAGKTENPGGGGGTATPGCPCRPCPPCPRSPC